MLIFTASEELNGNTYATATTEYGEEIDIIVHDESTDEEWNIWVEVDDIRNASYIVCDALIGTDYDGYKTVIGAIADVAYILEKELRYYR